MRRPFEDEYPMRPLDTSAAEAAAPTLQYTNEDYNTLASKLYTQTNTILPVPVQPRPKYAGTDISVASPTDLFKDSIRLESKHGPFVEQLLRKSNCTHVILNAHQFWDFLVEWFSLMSKRLKNALRRRNVGKQPRHMHSQADVALLFVICENEFMRDAYLGLTFDLRSWWEAQRDGLPLPPIMPIKQGDERRDNLNATGLKRLQSLSQTVDADMFDMMSNSKFDSGFDVPAGERMLVLDPNADEFDQHIKISIEKVEDELDQGMLQGFYLGPPFMPIMILRHSYIVQKGKPRRICQANAPYNFTWEGEDVSLNAGISTEDMHPLALPTVFNFALNSMIAASLYAATGDADLKQEQIYTDYTAFYRYLVPMLFFAWTTCNFLHPSGCTCDMGTGFGQMSAPFLANRVMNVLLFYWSLLFLLLLDECTTWDVTTASACELGQSDMVSKAEYLDWSPELRDLARSLTANMPRSCVGWDKATSVRQWRQNRYSIARQAGYCVRDAIWESLPYARSGFFDDAQQSAPACMAPMIVSCILRLAALTGVDISIPKMQWAKTGMLAIATPLVEKPTCIEQLYFAFEPGFAVCLGRLMQNTTFKIFDTPERIAHCIAWATRLCDTAQQHSKHMISFSELQALAGLLVFIIMIRPELRGRMNSVWRCLGHAASQNSNYYQRRRMKMRISEAAIGDLREICHSLPLSPGYAFAPSTKPIGADLPVVFVLNDAAGASSVEDASQRFAGGGVWLYTAAANKTLWSNVQWTKEQLLTHSTEQELANANCSLEAVIELYPDHDIVEVLDSLSAVTTLRTLSCKSATLERQLRFRLTLLEAATQRIFSLWSERRHGTLADMQSKDQQDSFRAALEARGLPAPQSKPFLRPTPRF